MVYCLCGKKKAIYGYAWKNPLACSECKDLGMTNVESKRCEFPGCMKIPSYGDPMQRSKRFCRAHASKKHINLCLNKCIKYGCKNPAKYGYIELEKPYYCITHSNIRMIDMTRKRCKYFMCHKTAYYGDQELKSKDYCSEHKLPHHINLTRKVETQS